MPVHFGDVWEPFIDRRGRLRFRRKDSLHGGKPSYVFASTRYLYLTGRDGKEIQLRRAGSKSGEKCPYCNKVLEGEVIRWKKKSGGYILLDMNVKCSGCKKTYRSEQYVYSYEKEKL